ncbi:MAG TPA: TnsD family Tn7-like transposition protein [Pyrinomonadaceae bacterium]|nr:TnsD family Tn7-like transposition protein [Pyrinomonadaceae bacterium]
MIGHLPTPNPDELLYSICARYASRVRYPSKKSVLLDLFGTHNVVASAGLPCRLDLLGEALPPGSEFTVKRLIDEHTLLPYYAPFVPAEREARLRRDMKESGGTRVYMRSGVMAGKVPLPEWFRFCPSCKAKDEKLHRETYWRRLHQLPGVLVCHSHKVFLERSSARIKYARNQADFFTATQSTPRLPARPLNHASSEDRLLLELARSSSWLLSAGQSAATLTSLRNRYLRLMIAQGLATYSGCVHADELLSRFRRHYPASLLKTLCCELIGRDERKHNWLLRLVRDPKHAQPPLHHLLLINFLGSTVEGFFSLPEDLSYFGESPWPCLNPASEHRGEGKIAGYKISYRGKNHRPVGTFSCECGFVYARTGPDETPEDRHRISKMKAFGPVWEAALRRLWSDPAFCASAIAARLEVDPLTVRRHAERLQLSLSGSRRTVTSLSHSLQLKAVNPVVEHERKRQKHRALWLNAMKKSPKSIMKVLRGNLPHTYAWLIQNDAAWLRSHRPLLSKLARATASVDWGRRDSKLALAVRESASRLKAVPGRPIRVTKTAIGRDLGQITLLQQKIYKLPLTAQAIADVIESNEDFAVRRVWQAANCYLRESTQPRQWQLLIRANVYRLRASKAVRRAVEDGIRMIESKLSLERMLRVGS